MASSPLPFIKVSIDGYVSTKSIGGVVQPISFIEGAVLPNLSSPSAPNIILPLSFVGHFTIKIDSSLVACSVLLVFGLTVFERCKRLMLFLGNRVEVVRQRVLLDAINASRRHDQPILLGFQGFFILSEAEVGFVLFVCCWLTGRLEIVCRRNFDYLRTPGRGVDPGLHGTRISCPGLIGLNLLLSAAMAAISAGLTHFIRFLKSKAPLGNHNGIRLSSWRHYYHPQFLVC